MRVLLFVHSIFNISGRLLRHYFSYDCGNAIDYIMTLCWFVPGPMREGFNRFIGLWSGEPRMQGRIQDFKLGGGALKKIAPSRGRREHFRGISCEKSLFYAKKS